MQSQKPLHLLMRNFKATHSLPDAPRFDMGSGVLSGGSFQSMKRPNRDNHF